MQISRWGNSRAVRLPAAVVEALAIKEGEEIEIHVVGERSIEINRKPGRTELLAPAQVSRPPPGGRQIRSAGSE